MEIQLSYFDITALKLSDIQQFFLVNVLMTLPPWPFMHVRRIRHAGHRWRSKHELISDVLLWTPSHGRVKVRRTARTYIQQLCADTECSLKERPGAMDDRDGWRERVWEIRAGGATRLWWHLYIDLIRQVCNPVCWDNRKCWLNLYREVRPNPNECSGYNTKLSDGDAPTWEFLGIWRNPSLPFIPGPFRCEMGVPLRG